MWVRRKVVGPRKGPVGRIVACAAGSAAESECAGCAERTMFLLFCTERSAVPLVGLVVSPARQGRRPDGKSGARFYDRGMERSSVESRLSELVHAAVPPSDLAVAAIVAGVPVEQTRPRGLRDIDVVWPQDDVEQ